MMLVVEPAKADQYEDQVTRQVVNIGVVFGKDGYRMSGDPYTARLANRGEESLTVTLSSGAEYVLVGACDNDCSDLDFKIYDENGNLIAEDDETDDTPIVYVTPSWSGKFDLKVNMYSCSDEPCVYGVVVLAK